MRRRDIGRNFIGTGGLHSGTTGSRCGGRGGSGATAGIGIETSSRRLLSSDGT